jgi:hypothetical protein
MRSEKRIKPFIKYIQEYWLKNPDQRFGQLLINLGLVEDSVVTWNCEMTDYTLPHEVIRGIQTWGTYGKKGTFGKKDIFIKDLLTDHIKAILKTQEHISDELRDVLKNELKFRKKNGK